MGSRRSSLLKEKRKIIEMPEVTGEHKEQAKRMAKDYEDDRHATTLPAPAARCPDGRQRLGR